MRFETKRERELRRKRQKRSAILGMVFAMLVVVGLGILLWNGKKRIEAKNVEYEKEITELQAQLDDDLLPLSGEQGFHPADLFPAEGYGGKGRHALRRHL